MKLRPLVVLFAALAVAGLAQAEVPLKEGGNYEVVSQEAETAKPVVMEFFSYGCPHCYRMEGFMHNYIANKPKIISVERIPIPIHDPKSLLARAYYVGEALGMLDKSHPALFKYLHEDEGKIDSKEDMVKFFVGLGADEAKVTSLVDSPDIEAKIKAGVEKAVRYEVTSTPTFVVNGKYRTDAAMAGDKLGEVLDELALRNQPAIFR